MTTGMETFSFVASVASVLPLFQSCAKLYTDITIATERHTQVEADLTLVSIERLTFERLKAVLVGNESTSSPQLYAQCQIILRWMEHDLKKVLELAARYTGSTEALPRSETPVGHEAGVVPGQTSLPTRLRGSVRAVTWVLNDKQQLKDLMLRLHQWNDALGVLVTEAKRQRIEFETTAATVASDNTRRLEDIEQATSNEYPAIAQRANVKKMTLQVQGGARDLDYIEAQKVTYKLPLESLRWLPMAQQHSTIERSTPSDDLTVEVAASQESAIALYHDPTIETAAGQSQTDEGDTRVFVEWRDTFRSEETFEHFERRLDGLARILRTMSDNDTTRNNTAGHSMTFSVLPCIGWVITSATFDRIGLVFRCPGRRPPRSQIPTSISNRPIISSLHDWIVRTRREQLDAPALGRRFGLAYGLAASVGNLISVRWIHRELRSHNILFIDDPSSSSQPYLSGFAYARPSDSNARDLSHLSAHPDHDLYRPLPRTELGYQQKLLRRMTEMEHHLPPTTIELTSAERNDEDVGTPGRGATAYHGHGKTPLRWTSAADLYGLGIVLLEIGYWRTISSLKGGSATSKTDFVTRVLDQLVDGLSYRVGELYRDVVRRLLRLGDWVDNDEEERAFFAQMIEALALCRA